MVKSGNVYNWSSGRNREGHMSWRQQRHQCTTNNPPAHGGPRLLFLPPSRSQLRARVLPEERAFITVGLPGQASVSLRTVALPSFGEVEHAWPLLEQRCELNYSNFQKEGGHLQRRGLLKPACTHKIQHFLRNQRGRKGKARYRAKPQSHLVSPTHKRANKSPPKYLTETNHTVIST